MPAAAPYSRGSSTWSLSHISERPSCLTAAQRVDCVAERRWEEKFLHSRAGVPYPVERMTDSNRVYVVFAAANVP